MENDSRMEELYRRILENQDNPDFLNQLKGLGSITKPEEWNEKLREYLERTSIPNKGLNEPPNKSLQTSFPPLSVNQVPIYKLLQNQIGFVKQANSQLAYKGYIEDMEAVYRGDFKYGKKEGIGEAVAPNDSRW